VVLANEYTDKSFLTKEQRQYNEVKIVFSTNGAEQLDSHITE